MHSVEATDERLGAHGGLWFILARLLSFPLKICVVALKHLVPRPAQCTPVCITLHRKICSLPLHDLELLASHNVPQTQMLNEMGERLL